MCCGRVIGPKNTNWSRVSDAHREYQRRLSEARYTRLWAVLRDLERHAIDLEAAAKAVIVQQREAYRRGFQFGKRRMVA